MKKHAMTGVKQRSRAILMLKGEDAVEWFKRMENAVEYLENHLEEALDINKAARVACASPFHFQRMFHMLTGATVAEYVRKRRLTRAAHELASTEAKVIDTALKYGYETPESFARAFRKLHGISPSEARTPGVTLKAYPRVSFHISIRGGLEMNYRIVEKESYCVVGKEIRVSTRDGENFRRIPEFWTECCEDGTLERLDELGSGEILGICVDFNHGEEEMSYMIAVAKENGGRHDGFLEKEIPAATWAVFESVGPLPDAIQKVWKDIFAEWFPSTGFEHAGGPEIEVCPPGDPKAPDYRCEVWVPVIKK